MFEKVANLWKHRDLRNKILFTLLILAIYRLIVHIPMPGVDVTQLQQFFGQSQLLGLYDLFSGGSVSSFSIALMGVVPYINASIIMQVMSMALPSLEALSKEGEYGRRKIGLYTRYLTVPLALIQAYGTILMLQNSSFQILGTISPIRLIAMLITAAAGTVLLMWLGELISERGIGNGMSLIIFAGIIASLPQMISGALVLSSVNGLSNLLIFAGLGIAMTFFIAYVNEGQRNIPIAYAGRATNNRLFGGVNTNLPLKVNQAGVIPIIFAISIIMVPGILAQLFMNARSVTLVNIATHVKDFFNNYIAYDIMYFVLVFAFTYFYTWVIFNPEKVAENIQKQGGFITGIRPGAQTVSYLSGLVNRVTFYGGIFLSLIAVAPMIVERVFNMGSLSIGGTSMLIMVSVVLDTMRQINAQLVMKQYEKV
jgi:preprotein translocase subunit SecY